MALCFLHIDRNNHKSMKMKCVEPFLFLLWLDPWLSDSGDCLQAQLWRTATCTDGLGKVSVLHNQMSLRQSLISHMIKLRLKTSEFTWLIFFSMTDAVRRVNRQMVCEVSLSDSSLTQWVS